MLYNIPDKMEKQALPKFCFVLGGGEGVWHIEEWDAQSQISCSNKIIPGDFGKQE